MLLLFAKIWSCTQKYIVFNLWFFPTMRKSTVTMPAQCHLYHKLYGAAVTTFHDVTSFNVKIVTNYYKKRWLANLVLTF